MKVSEMIGGLKQVLDEKGDLDVYYSLQDKDTKNISSIPLATGGAGPFGADGALVAFVSCDSMEEVFNPAATGAVIKNQLVTPPEETELNFIQPK